MEWLWSFVHDLSPWWWVALGALLVITAVLLGMAWVYVLQD